MIADDLVQRLPHNGNRGCIEFLLQLGHRCGSNRGARLTDIGGPSGRKRARVSALSVRSTGSGSSDGLAGVAGPALSGWPVEALGEGEEPETSSDGSRDGVFYSARSALIWPESKSFRAIL
jgi:hypothetical protein